MSAEEGEDVSHTSSQGGDSTDDEEIAWDVVLHFSPSQLGNFYHTKCDRQLAFSAARIERHWWFHNEKNRWILFPFSDRIMLEKGFLKFQDAIGKGNAADQVRPTWHYLLCSVLC